MDNANPFDQLVDQVPETSDNPFDALVSSPAEEKPAAPANPFESLVDEADQDAVSTTKQSIIENSKSGVDPKRMAEAIRIGKEQGVPAEVVYDNIGTFKADPKAAIASMTHAAPVTSKLLADPIKGPVLFPDHQPLTDAEQAVQELNALADFTKKNPPAPAPSEPGWGYLTPEESKLEQQRLLNAYATDQVNLAKTKKAAEAAQAARLAEEKQQSEVDISQERALGITNYVQPPMDPFGMGDPENVGAFKKSMDYNAANIETLMKVEPIMTRLRDQVGRTVQTITNMTVGAGAGATDIINAIRTLLPGEVPGGSVQVPGTNASPIEILNNPFANETSKFSSVGSYAPQGGWSEDEPPPALADPQERQKLNNVFAKMEKWIVDNVPTDRARDDEFVSKLNAGITSTGVFLAGGWAARALGLSSEAATAILGTLSGAHSGQQDAAQRGATPDQEAIQTLLSGMMGLTEIVPIEKYLDWAEEAGGPFWQRAFSRMIAGGRTEGIQEVMQNAPTDVFAKLTYDPERNVFANAWDNFLVAATTGGLFGAMTAVSNPNPEKAKEQLDRYRKAITGTQASQIAPELLEEHLVEMKKAGKAPEFVTAKVEEVEALFQEMDPEVLKNVFPDAEAAIQEARDSNAEVSIPTEKLAHLAQLQGFGRFVDHVRLDPDAPTVAEQKKLKEDVDRLLSEMDTSSTTEAPGTESSPVFMTIRDQLVKAGHSADTAAPMARIYESFFTTQAERIGMDPVELLRRYGLEITNSEITAEQMAPQLEQLRKEWADPTRPETPAGAVASQSSPASTIPDTTSLRSQLAAAGITPQALAGMTNEQVTQTLAERTLAQDEVQASPEFTNWFTGSKAVDDQGAPLVVYHATEASFDTFNTRVKSPDQWFGQGSYFATRESDLTEHVGVSLSEGHRVIQAHLSIKNPYIWDVSTPEKRASLQADLTAAGVQPSEFNGETLNGSDAPRKFTDWAKAQGYDGVFAMDLKGRGQVDEIVAFDPTQIKSVNNRGTFDPNNPNILYQDGAPVIDGQSQQPGNKHGLAPHLRVETGVEIPKGKKPLFAQVTMNSTAPRQIAAIDEVLSRHPNATASVENWNAMMSDALASNDVPVPPYAFITNINGDGSRKLLEQLSPGQIADADHGFKNAGEFRQAYINGEISIEDTGRLFLWSFLSRGVSPYTQESLFIDSFDGIDQWIQAAADGTLKDRLDEYEAWAKTAAPQGSGQPGAGATHNLNAFGKLFLMKMSEDAGDGSGRSRLQVLHDMMKDPNSTGRDIRRKFLEMGEGVGIDNKVVSFTLLVAGFDDIMVLDRVQIRELWNDGRFDGVNLYDGYKVDGKPVTGSALSSLTYGARGLLIYEAIEQGLKTKIQDLYTQLGRPEAASPGRYHWETWVASSNQEASHATIDAILARAKGATAPLAGVTAKEGEYGAFAYGARYGRDGMGQPYFLYSVPGVGDFEFSVPAFRDFLDQIKVKANGIIPGKFKVTESGNGPWYNRPEVNVQKLGELAGRIGERFEAEPISAADAANGIDPPVANRLAADQPGTAAQDQVTEGPQAGPSSSKTLYQGGAAPTNARGFITFNQTRDKFRITLTGNANLSTFLHESGHFFLEVMQDLVEKGLATDQQRADLEILRTWMGLKPGEKIGVKQHEQFARGTEAYFMEGKAPSNELVGAFQRFKSWLTFVYRSLAGLNVKLTDEVRGVMDRLLASDQAIAEARAQVGWRGAPMSQQETGLTDAEYKAYTEAWIKANDAQSHDADARVLLEAARELKKVWRDEKVAMTNQMQEELAKTRGYRAWRALAYGEVPDDAKPELANLKITPDSIPQEWKRDAQGMTSPPYEAGLPLDYVAERLGFDSGEQMLSLIAGAKAAQKTIPAKVRAAMEAKHGRMDVNALATEAAKAVHNKPTMDVLLTEFRAMASKAGQNVPKQIGAILAAQARAKVAELTQRQLQPTKWRRAELKAAHEAGQAAGRGDAQGAFLAKRRQMVAASMVKATLDAQDRIEKIRDYLSTFQTDRRRAQLGKAGEMYLDGVDQILENLELKDVPLKLLKKRPLLQDIVQKAIEEDEPINIPAEILGMGKRNYSQLTLGELEAVHDAVKNLWTLAKLKNQLKSRQGKIQLDKAMEQIAATADAFLGEKRQPDTLNPTAIDRATSKLRWVRAKLVKMEFLFSWLDGRPDGGLAHQLIYQPIADARAAEYKLMEDMTRKILDPIRNMPREQRQRWDTKRTFMGKTMKGANIIAVALNMGNEQNKKKLLEGYGWNENLVMAELNQFMTKADWDMVQQIWDAIDSLWPHIERTAKNATGLAPDRVVPSPVITPHGQYSGGYYPIVYDPFRTQKVAERQEAKASANGLFANNFLRPTLDNGFTKKRTGYVAPIYLSLDVLSQHLAETIHYVTHYEAVKQADKIRSHPVFQELVTRNMGREFWSELRPWLQDIANNVTQRRYPEFGDAAMRYFRVGTTVAAMGFNIGTALKQTFGIATSLVAVSPRYWASGVYKAWMSPNIAKNWRFALKESQELRPLIHDFDRDVKQINDTFAMSLGKQLHASILQKAFLHIGAMQLTVNVATWHGAYEQALARGDSHEMAVIHADSVVRKTQSAGSIKDLADVQRSGEATKMLTMFYSYFSVVYNQLEDISKNTNSVKDIPRAASKIVMLSIVPTLLNMGYEAGKAALFGGGDDGEDEDQQSFITSLMLESVNQLVGAVPLLRNMISFGDHGGKVNIPIMSKLDQMQNAASSIKTWISEGEAPSRKQVRTMVDVFSMLTKTPIAPMYKLIDDAIGVNLEE